MSTDRTCVVREILSYESGRFFSCRRELVEEVFWTLRVNGRDTGSFSCSPWDLEQAVLGYLFLHRMIQRASDVSQLVFQPNHGIIEISLDRTPPPPPENKQPLSVSAGDILHLAFLLEDSSKLFHRTGGVHSAALARQGELLVYKEDVSRHVAVEKAAGACLEQEIPMENSILVFSGRVPGEIVRMADVMGCGMIVALSAPTDFACQQAALKQITLVGFARNDRFNVYTCPDKIIL